MPKVNLHLHLEGALRPQTFLELGQARGHFKGQSAADMLRILQVTGSETSLAEVLQPILRACLITQDAAALRRIAREVVEDQAAQNVIYAEVRVAPRLHTQEGLSIEAVLEALLEGLQEGERNTGCIARLIVIAVRTDPPELNVPLARIAARYLDQGVVGFDLAGDEVGYPAESHREAFAVARDQGLHITVHAGESGGPDSVRGALDLLKAERIGHGVHAVEDPALIERLRHERIPLEVSVTSNILTRAFTWTTHPVRALFEAGVRVIPADDDPTALKCSMSGEFRLWHEQFGFSPADLARCVRWGFEHAFCDEGTKAALLRRTDL